jgi:MFS family permease
MTNYFALLKKFKDQTALFSLLLIAVLFISSWLVFDPHWQTNDDVAMSMVAHGYGLAEYGSPCLVFSNVLWGHVVRSIPIIGGILGYSLATLIVLLLTGWAIFYFLLRAGVGYFVGVLAIILVFSRPILFPQFTINSGLLAVAAVIGLQVYNRFNKSGILIVTCILAFLGYLIRSHEFVLVLCVSLPLLPWRSLYKQRQLKIAFMLLAVMITLAAIYNRWSYCSPEWKRFMELNSARAPYTDFGVSDIIKQHPEIMARHGYSKNDMELIEKFFFADLKIADAKSLNSMMAELSPPQLHKGSIRSGYKAISKILSASLLPILLPALILFIMRPRFSVALAWLLCLIALFIMGAMGRPGILRVYVPLVSFVFLIPLVIGQVKDVVSRWGFIIILLVACIVNTYGVVHAALEAKQATEKVQRSIDDLPAGPVICWGEAFPFEAAFPVLVNRDYHKDIRLYVLGVFTYAPFTIAVGENNKGRGMIDRLCSSEGVPIIASQANIAMLRSYCQEHLAGKLRLIEDYSSSTINVQQLKCEKVL